MAKLIIAGDGPNMTELEGLIGRHDVPEFVSDSLGLAWQSGQITLRHSSGNADFADGDTVLVDFSRGIWCIPGIAHELVHLLLRQNGWPDPGLLPLEKRVPELSNDRGPLYGIEQIIAYLVQANFAGMLARTEGNADLAAGWGDARFGEIVRTEYRSDTAREIVGRIIGAWSARPRSEPITSWLVQILFD